MKLLKPFFAVFALLVASGCMGHDVVTYSDFKQVQPNMPLVEIQQKIGSKGRLKKSDEFIYGTPVDTLPGEEVYVWENKDGSNMSVSVIDGKIVGVTQSGLN